MQLQAILSDMESALDLLVPSAVDRASTIIAKERHQPGTPAWINLDDAIRAWTGETKPGSGPSTDNLTDTLDIKVWYGLMKAQLIADLGDLQLTYEQLSDAVEYLDNTNASVGGRYSRWLEPLRSKLLDARAQAGNVDLPEVVPPLKRFPYNPGYVQPSYT